MIDSYDPLKAPDPKEWLKLEEEEQINLVYEYHKNIEQDIPNIYIHSVIHTVVENQIAMGDELPVKDAIKRLMDEELDRHQAIHAVASVLIKYLWDLKANSGDGTQYSQEYFDELRELTVQKWFDEFG